MYIFVCVKQAPSNFWCLLFPLWTYCSFGLSAPLAGNGAEQRGEEAGSQPQLHADSTRSSTNN